MRTLSRWGILIIPLLASLARAFVRPPPPQHHGFVRALTRRRANDDRGSDGTGEPRRHAALPPGGTTDRVFENLVQYPCNFEVKLIGVNEGAFVDDILNVVSGVTGVPSRRLPFSVRVSESKKFISLSIDAPVKDADMLYEIYNATNRDSRIKYTL
jgi:putative lipoic acid-binding regulatory protein